MSSTPSQILRLELIGTGDQAGTWGNTTNTNLGTLLEGAVAGLASVSVTSANQALTATDYAADQARMAILTLTTTTLAAFNVYAPPVSKTYVVYNNSAYDATIFNSTALGNTTAAGLGVTIPAGRIVSVWSNGTNFYKQATSISLTTDVTGTLPVANGGTGATTLTGVLKGNGTSAFTASNVNLASEVTGTLPVANGGTGATTFSSGQFLKGAGTSAVTTAATVALGSEVSGTLLVSNGGTGATSLTANNVLLGNGTSAVQVVAPSTTGNILTSNGTTWTSAAPASQYAGPNFQAFTSSGTFTVPTGITRLTVYVWGGGGGGGYITGADGGFGIGQLTGLTPGASITVTVGGGGAGGRLGIAGSTGGTSSFSTFVSCTGGGGGSGAALPPTPAAGSATFTSGGGVTVSRANSVWGLYFGGAQFGSGLPPGSCCFLPSFGGGAGMSGGGGGGGSGSVAGGVAYGFGSNGVTGGVTTGGAGGGTNGGAGGPYGGGQAWGAGGGGTGGVIVYW
jgi:hypothetical protein